MTPITDGYLRFISISDLLRRYDEAHPGQLTAWRTIQNWVKLIEWQMLPGERTWSDLWTDVSGFLKAGDNKVCSDNPWSIMRRLVPRFSPGRANKHMNYRVEEYRVGRVLNVEAERKWIEQQAQIRRHAAMPRIKTEFELAVEDTSDLD